MSTAVYSTPSLSIPPSQNTAPVIEFRCLYTYDVRRKQKRWQDGFLRFHTFNKRVMVYDVPRNYIGDHHWKDGEELQEGDEVTLDKGVLVEVGEVVGTTETDLSPLFQRKPKEMPERDRAASTAKAASSIRSGAVPAPPPLRHKSLNTLLGTPKGSLGRAVLPTKSPYEARHNVSENEWEDGPSAKRPRTSAYTGWDVVRTSKPPASGSKEETPLWAKTSGVRNGRITKPATSKSKPSTSQSRLTVKEIIDITSNAEDTSSDLASGDAPTHASKPTLPLVASARSRKDVPPPRADNGRPEQRIPRAWNGLTQGLSSPLTENKSLKAMDRRSRPFPLATPAQEEPQPPSSPPVSTTNKIHAVENITDRGASTTSSPALCASNSLEAPIDSISAEAPPNSRGKALRLSVAAPRKKMLLCEARPKSRAATSKNNPEAPNRTSGDRSPRQRSATRQESPEWDFDFGVTSNKPVIQDATAARRKTDAAKPEWLAKPKGKPLPRRDSPDERQPTNSTTTALEDMALVHGRMDEQLMIASRRVEGARPSVSAKPAAKSTDSSRGPFRRVLSENDAPSAALGPSAVSANSELASSKRPKAPAAAKVTAPPKRQLQRVRSLAEPARVRRVPTPPPPVFEDTDVGPWSTEAFDLFDWRPPDRDAEGNISAAPPEG